MSATTTDGGDGAAPASPGPRPLCWGMQAGFPQMLHRVSWGEQLLREFGIDRWVLFHPPKSSGAVPLARIVDDICAVDAWCAQHGIDWVANLEAANYHATFVDERGRDWFNQPDGRHFYDAPDDILAVWGACRQLRGLLYDEAELMQTWRNGTVKGMRQPWLYAPAGPRLEDAAAEFTAAVTAHAQRYARHGLRLCTEHVLPIGFHSFARGGWTAATKILKENWAAPCLACAMGAALQYGTELWVCPDLWDGAHPYPGHSPAEYRSALLLAYHLGADCIYTENLDGDFGQRGVGSLVLTGPDGYRVTGYGKEALWFRHEYLPAHPRGYDLRSVRPRVAIIRQEDTCWGQADSWLPDHLFGAPAWRSTPVTEAWLRLWHLLSCGTIPADSLSWHGGSTWRQWHGRPHQTFCPLDGVVVFDHLVTGELLRGVEVIFLTGLGVSRATADAVAEQVAAGATCVALPHLLPEAVARATGCHGTVKDGAGVWVATEDFLAPQARLAVRQVLPDAHTLRYRFGEHTVTLRPVDGDPDRLEVDVQEPARGRAE